LNDVVLLDEYHVSIRVPKDLDRLDAILDGLDNALAGAVQAVICTAVKEAVQAVLTEVLTNRELQVQLQQAAQPTLPPEEPHSKQNIPSRLWQATTASVRRTVQMVKKLGRSVCVALVAAGGVLAGIVYAARKKITSAATAAYQGGRRLLGRAITALTNMLPSFVFCGT
jgi:hypothetical protein